MTLAPGGSLCAEEALPVPPPHRTKRPPKWTQSTLAGSVLELLTRYAEGVPRPAERRIAVMNTSLQEFAPSPQALGREWRHFANRLAAALAALEEDQNLVVAVTHRQRLVQFAGSGASGLRAESVSNGNLAEADLLKCDRIAALTASGWRSPTHAPDGSKADKGPAGSAFIEISPGALLH